MTPKPEEKSPWFTREEAEFKLNRILERYGIQPAANAAKSSSTQSTHESLKTDSSPEKPDDGGSELQDFHFLIQIVECAVTLHCHVVAQSAAEARSQLDRIPNLIEWREISAKELAELTKTD